MFASFLTLAVAVVFRHAGAAVGNRIAVLITASGTVLLAGAAALAFDGPNAWWQSTVYDVPWSAGPISPAGLPLNNPLLWLGVAASCGVLGIVFLARDCRWAFRMAPAAVAVTAAATAVVVLLGSFVAAPFRRPAGSLALTNINRLTGSRVCGLADDIEVLPDGPVLTPLAGDGRSTGFGPMAGYHPGAPPPDPPGKGSSSRLWGSFGSPDDASITTPWFALPPLGANEGVAVSVSGRTDAGNSLVFEFGRSDGGPLAVVRPRLETGSPSTRTRYTRCGARSAWTRHRFRQVPTVSGSGRSTRAQTITDGSHSRGPGCARCSD